MNPFPAWSKSTRPVIKSTVITANIQVKELAQKVINALHRKTGELGGYPIQRMLLENCQDGFDEKATLHRQILSFVIYH